MQHRAKKSRAYTRMINIEGKERQRFTHIQIRGRRGDLWWRHGQEFQELIKDANLHVSQTKPVKPKPDEWKSLWTQRPKSDNAEPQRIRALKSTKDKRQISHKGKTIGLTSTLSTSAGGSQKRVGSFIAWQQNSSPPWMCIPEGNHFQGFGTNKSVPAKISFPEEILEDVRQAEWE